MKEAGKPGMKLTLNKVGRAGAVSMVSGMMNKPIPAIQLLERVLGTRTAAIVRWLLFLPAGLVIGIGLFLLFGLGGANAARYFGDDATAPAAFVGGIIAGGFSVYTAMRVAPG